MKKLIAPENLDPELAKKSQTFWDGLSVSGTGVGRVCNSFGARKVAETAKGRSVFEFVGVTEGIKRDRSTIRVAGIDTSSLKRNPVFLWGHSYSTPPIGVITKTARVKVDGGVRALAITVAPLDLSVETDHTRFADMIWDMYDKGFMRTVSFGWNTLEADPIYEKTDTGEEHWTGGFDFKRTEALEFSAVPVPADPDAIMRTVRKYGFDSDVMDRFNSCSPSGVYVLRETLDELESDPEVEKVDFESREQEDPPAPAPTRENEKGNEQRAEAEVEVRAGAVINKRNLEDLKSAYDLLGRVISTAEKNEEESDTSKEEPRATEASNNLPESETREGGEAENVEDDEEAALDQALEYFSEREEQNTLDALIAVVSR